MVFQLLNSATLDCLEHHILSSLQYGLEALDNNQATIDTLISGHSYIYDIYIYDLVEQRNLSGSCSITSMLGYRPDDIAAIEPLGLASLIHPDDLNRVAEHFQRFTTLHYDEVISIEYRMKRADGWWCWLRSQETPLVVAIDGVPLQILGIVQVPTQRSSAGSVTLNNTLLARSSNRGYQNKA